MSVNKAVNLITHFVLTELKLKKQRDNALLEFRNSKLELMIMESYISGVAGSFWCLGNHIKEKISYYSYNSHTLHHFSG